MVFMIICYSKQRKKANGNTLHYIKNIKKYLHTHTHTYKHACLHTHTQNINTASYLRAKTHGSSPICVDENQSQAADSQQLFSNLPNSKASQPVIPTHLLPVFPSPASKIFKSGRDLQDKSNHQPSTTTVTHKPHHSASDPDTS